MSKIWPASARKCFSQYTHRARVMAVLVWFTPSSSVSMDSAAPSRSVDI